MEAKPDGAIGPAAVWLLEPATSQLDPHDFLVGLTGALAGSGLPLVRSSAWLPTLHPELWGTQLIWIRGKGCKVIQRAHEITGTDLFRGTPGETVYHTRAPVRCRLDLPRAELEYPVLAEIADEGGTDYLIVPVGMGQAEGAWITFATDRPGGFTAAELSGLRELRPLLSLHFQLATARLATRSLLNVYLGRNAARHVLAGSFKRGSGTSISAAIWFCDMRGFTALGDQLAPREVVDLLDRYFECVAGPIEERGGEILKFIGDAALAIFPVGAAGPADPCARALQAAEGALEAIAGFNRAAAAEGRREIGMGVALHLGEVMYGNIGGRERLDFTVIGGAVNEVCRVESLCKTVGSQLLMTATFARELQRDDLVVLGKHALRGVPEPQEILALRKYAPRA